MLRFHQIWNELVDTVWNFFDAVFVLLVGLPGLAWERLGPFWYLSIAFATWYVGYGLFCASNGATFDRNSFLMPFQCFWEELLWNLPGGTKRKITYLKENVLADFEEGSVESTWGIKTWDFREVRSKNLYKACARSVLPGSVYFYGFVVGGTLFWPAMLFVFILLVIISVAFAIICGIVNSILEFCK